MDNWHQIYHEIITSLQKHPSGGLMILAPGISIPKNIALLLTYFLERRANLIFLVNFTPSELQLIDFMLTLFLAGRANPSLASSIARHSKSTLEKRKQAYLAGGIILVSTQIFIQDIFNGVLEPKLVTHLIVQRAHTIDSKFDQECLLTTLIKLQNPRVFLLAITDQPHILLARQSIQTIIRHLFLSQVFPWSFNRLEILSNIKENEFVWKEHIIPLRKAQQNIQESLIVLIEESVQELNRKLGQRGMLTVGNFLHSSKSRLIILIRKMRSAMKDFTQSQLFQDIICFKRMLFQLLEYKETQYYQQAQEMVQQANIDSILLVPDASIEKAIKVILEQSKSRVFSIQRTEYPINYVFPAAADNILADNHQIAVPYKFTIKLKPNPKLEQLRNILTSISEQQSDGEEIRVWVWCKNSYQKYQIQVYLNNCFRLNDPDDHLTQFLILKNYLNNHLKARKDQYSRIMQNPKSLTEIHSGINKANAALLRKQEVEVELCFLQLLEKELNDFYAQIAREREQYLIQHRIQLKQAPQLVYQLLPESLTRIDISLSAQEIDETGKLQIYSEDGIIKGLNIVINTFEADSDRTIFQHEYKPHVIIMMDPNNQMLREIMLERQNGTLKEVHAIFFQGSIESQIFYKDKLDEDQAFEQLIQECSKLPQFDETPKDMIEEFQPVAQASTRVGRGAEFFKQVSESSTKPYIIVDFREFRSELPAQLFYKGFNIVPMMLKTGDYVLSNQVIIERKCVETGDLVESILGRRLDEQLKRMSEYEYPFLLIEYSERIPFDLQSLQKGSYFQKQGPHEQDQVREQPRQQSKTRMLFKIYELLWQYPKVQLLWSKSSANSAQIMQQLKQTLAQATPDLELFRKQQIREDEVLDLPDAPAKDDLDQIVI